MTSHELAARLLSLPNVPVICLWDSERPTYAEITSAVESIEDYNDARNVPSTGTVIFIEAQ